MEQKIRVVMAKPGLDGHDRGIKILARAFIEAGMENLRQKSELLTAYQEFVIQDINNRNPEFNLEIITPSNPEKRGITTSPCMTIGKFALTICPRRLAFPTQDKGTPSSFS